MSDASHGGSVRAIFYALGANFGIAVSKFVAAAWTGSGSMLAEGIHSSADCINQLLLLLGMKEAKDRVEAAPKAVMEKVTREAAAKAKEALEAAGVAVSVK